MARTKDEQKSRRPHTQAGRSRAARHGKRQLKKRAA
jgi:hypothetical protein